MDDSSTLYHVIGPSSAPLADRLGHYQHPLNHHANVQIQDRHFPSARQVYLPTVGIFKSSLTFEVLWAAHELDTGEQRDSAGQQHGEASHLHVSVLACGGAGLIPPDERPASGRVVDVVKQATLGHQKSV